MSLAWTVEDLAAWVQGQVWAEPLVGVAGELRAEVALVGGMVRDALLKGEPGTDVDVVVSGADAREVAARLGERLRGKVVPLDTAYGIYRVVFWPDAVSGGREGEPMTVDVAAAQGGSIAADLGRRDLTVNALAFELTGGGRLLDSFEGLGDLKACHIRMVAERNLIEDPLRLLRVFRFMAVMGARSIEGETLAAVERNRRLLWQVAGERIQYEWLKLMAALRVMPTLEAMLECGLLEELQPELTPCREVPPNTHHHLPLLAHTLELVRQLDEVWVKLPEGVKAHLLQPVGQGSNRLAVVRWACLLHDIGKPATWTIDEDDPTRHRFLGHEAEGERMCTAIAQRFRVSEGVAARLKHLVRWHLYPCQFGPESSEKSVLRFFRRMGDNALDVTVLALVDRLSTCGPAISEETLRESEAAHYWLMETYLAKQAAWSAPPLVNGKDVMDLLNLKPGRQVGEVLAAVREAQQLGEVATKAEALAWVRGRFG